MPGCVFAVAVAAAAAAAAVVAAVGVPRLHHRNLTRWSHQRKRLSPAAEATGSGGGHRW